MCSPTPKALTFDLFGTILDLEGSLTPVIQRFLIGHGSSLEPTRLWRELRARQRIEQYQDNLLMLGHSGYLGAVRRAFRYVLNLNAIPFTDEEVQGFVESWKGLSPFEDAVEGLNRLRGRYRLVVLSNGEDWFLRHLLGERVGFEFDEVFSVERVGVFKPHPAVYRACARMLGREPHELMMVSSNTFDVMGARACGFQAAWVRRQELPYEETLLRPTLVVRDFLELSDSLSRSET
ncbi:haloacid dehalogenase [miscellaneous Crenarchaeota group-15 archaeon DG-45]|uniref:Haloacid dehalogenase n=1 Tax=miscellaneous Crenarchaeota group-15 archaeon DG-45 TaxID=1685127 RepID=A0A0M0BP09_9ARCH|nr:MAG: haloacid dehalogenase [miscellaneous Crenarchaeota group-15 archaeon DG-45]